MFFTYAWLLIRCYEYYLLLRESELWSNLLVGLTLAFNRITRSRDDINNYVRKPKLFGRHVDTCMRNDHETNGENRHETTIGQNTLTVAI